MAVMIDQKLARLAKAPEQLPEAVQGGVIAALDYTSKVCLEAAFLASSVASWKSVWPRREIMRAGKTLPPFSSRTGLMRDRGCLDESSHQ